MESPPVQNKYVVRMLLIVANGVERNEREKSVHRGNFTNWLLTLLLSHLLICSLMGFRLQPPRPCKAIDGNPKNFLFNLLFKRLRPTLDGPHSVSISCAVEVIDNTNAG